MSDQQIQQVEEALTAFIVRAAGENAKPEEVQVLPAVAKVFVELIPPCGAIPLS